MLRQNKIDFQDYTCVTIITVLWHYKYIFSFMEIHDLIKDIKVILKFKFRLFFTKLINERNNYFTNKVKYKLNSAVVVKKIIIDKK